MSECTHKTMEKQNMRENRASDRWNLKSQSEQQRIKKPAQ